MPQWKAGLLIPVLLLTPFIGLFAAGALAATATAAPEASPQDIRQVIETLENDKARKQLVGQLNVMLQAMEAEHPATGSEVATATAELLRSISTEIVHLASGATRVVDVVDVLPKTAEWFGNIVKDPEARRDWAVLIARLAAILGSGYLAAWLVFRLLVQPRRAALATRRYGRFGSIAIRSALLLLDLVPIAVFALTAYPVLAVVDPNEESRLVALAWINASIIVRVALAAGRFLFSPDTRALRLFMPMTRQLTTCKSGCGASPAPPSSVTSVCNRRNCSDSNRRSTSPCCTCSASWYSHYCSFSSCRTAQRSAG